MKCPCKSGLLYEECCGPYHAGRPAPTPLALMRSRYSGYALQKFDYIIDTSHPDLQRFHHPISQWRQGIVDFSRQTSFDDLKITEVDVGDKEGFVTFKACLSQNGKDVSFMEKSRFEKKDGKWLYHSGVMIPSDVLAEE